MSKRVGDRHFTIGLIYSAWALCAGHKEYQLAVFLLKESNIPVSTLRRIAHAEGYEFHRGFWKDVDTGRGYQP